MITSLTGSFRIGIVVLLLSCASVVFAQPKTAETLGVLDARSWNFSKRLPLKGNWSFYENKLVHPDDVAIDRLHSTTYFPSLWNDYRPDGKGMGCATYALDVILPDSFKTVALEIPQMYSCYKLWVNGNLVAIAGTPGSEKEFASPQWIYQTAVFSNSEDTLRIVLQLANFHHYKGGAKDPIYLGTPERINSHFAWAIGSNVIEAIILLIEGFVFLFFYRRKKKPVILYFALLCLTWSVRSVFSNLYPLVLVAPDINWQVLLKVEYITLYLTVIWAALFFNSLFKDISNVIFTYLPVSINVFFILFTLLTPAITFSRWVSVYLGIAFLVILYGAALIVRALIIEREGSWFLMASLWVGVLLFGYDIAAYHSSYSYNIVWLNFGYVIIFLLTTLALLYHLRVLKSGTLQKTVLTYNDLYQERKK